MRSRIPAIVAGVYCALIAVSIVFVFTGNGALSGIFVVVLGLPWIAFLTTFVDALYPERTGNVATGLMIGIAGSAINAAIIYFVSRWVMRRIQSRKSAKAPPAPGSVI